MHIFLMIALLHWVFIAFAITTRTSSIPDNYFESVNLFGKLPISDLRTTNRYEKQENNHTLTRRAARLTIGRLSSLASHKLGCGEAPHCTFGFRIAVDKNGPPSCTREMFVLSPAFVVSDLQTT